MRTDAVYLYLLNSKYSRINSLIRRFSWDNCGLGSLSSSRALKISARILALKCPNTPLFSKVSFKTVKYRILMVQLQNKFCHSWAYFEEKCLKGKWHNNSVQSKHCHELNNHQISYHSYVCNKKYSSQIATIYYFNIFKQI